jgi:hypothetical protein
MNSPEIPRREEGTTSSGEAAKGLIRAEVDRGGNLVRLTIDSHAMRMAAAEIAEAATSAVQQAQTAARAAFNEGLGGAVDGPTAQQIRQSIGGLAATADRQFAEISTVLDELTRRAGGPA